MEVEELVKSHFILQVIWQKPYKSSKEIGIVGKFERWWVIIVIWFDYPSVYSLSSTCPCQ